MYCKLLIRHSILNSIILFIFSPSCTDPALQLFFSTFQYTRLECSTRRSQTLSSFKRCLGTNCKPPVFYYAGCRKGQTLWTRLRLGCSALNLNLHSLAVVP